MTAPTTAQTDPALRVFDLLKQITAAIDYQHPAAPLADQLHAACIALVDIDTARRGEAIAQHAELNSRLEKCADSLAQANAITAGILHESEYLKTMLTDTYGKAAAPLVGDALGIDVTPDMGAALGAWIVSNMLAPRNPVDSFAAFASEIGAIRIAQRLDYETAAAQTIGLDAQTIAGIESGHHAPTFSEMVDLLGALGYGFVIEQRPPTTDSGQ